MTKYGIAKQVVSEYFYMTQGGLFDCYSLLPDEYYVVYDEDGLEIRVCEQYEYVEVVGLSEYDFECLRKWWLNEAWKRGWTWLE